jgi:hypothetical protein
MGDGRVLGEVFLGFGGWVRRFWCAFFFPEECMIRRVMIFIFFVEGGGGGGGVLGVLIGGSEKEHIVIFCCGTHWEPKKNEKKPSPHPPTWPLLPKFKRNKSKAP